MYPQGSGTRPYDEEEKFPESLLVLKNHDFLFELLGKSVKKFLSFWRVCPRIQREIIPLRYFTNSFFHYLCSITFSSKLW